MTIKTKSFESPKNCIFPLFVFVETMTKNKVKINNVLDTKEPFFDYKRKISKSPTNCIFPEGLTHAFGQKMPILSVFGFGQNKTKNKV